MKMIFKAFLKKLFGTKYEKMVQILFVYLFMFFGLHIADFQIQIAPFIVYLMVSTFTAGVMWQTLSSEENAVNMQNMIMLPFERWKFVFSYIAAMGLYVFLMKTMPLMIVVIVVSVWNQAVILGSVLCAVNTILMTAVIFALKRYWYVEIFWIAMVCFVILFAGDKVWFIPILFANIILALLLLQGVNGYAFYIQENRKNLTVRSHKHCLIWIYFFRYLKSHKNYLLNTVIMWCVACVLPLYFRQMESSFAIPIGFAILSLNTPICILLSCNPSLEQTVRFLPAQKKNFCIPYCLFISICNIIVDVIFICSWQMQAGGMNVYMITIGIYFAIQSAVCSAFLEWFYPIRGWKVESDLWHHPRKYIVPTVMLLLAGVVGTIPAAVFILPVLLIVEILIMSFWRLALNSYEKMKNTGCSVHK